MTPETRAKLVELQAKLALASIAIPSPAGDVVGLGSDAMGMAVDPSQRTLGNAALSAAGLIPFVPSPSGAKAAVKAAEEIGGRAYGAAKGTKEYDALHSMADFQRGIPEVAMMKVQKTLQDDPVLRKTRGNGVLAYLVEHVGDLTHRIGQYGGYFGPEYVAPKVEAALRILSNPSDLEDLAKMPKFAELAKYGLAHNKVQAVNGLTDAAKQAAISLGQGDFHAARHHLTVLKKALDDGTWAEQAYKVDPSYVE